MEEINLKCPEVNCPLIFKKRYNLNRHYEKFHLHATIVEKCYLCGHIFENCHKLQEHYISHHTFNKKFKVIESAFRKSIITYRYTFRENEFNFPKSQHNIRKNVFIFLEGAPKMGKLVFDLVKGNTFVLLSLHIWLQINLKKTIPPVQA